MSLASQECGEGKECCREQKDREDCSRDRLVHEGSQDEAEAQQRQPVSCDQEENQERIGAGQESTVGQEQGEDDADDEHGDGGDEDPDQPDHRVPHAHDLHDLKRKKETVRYSLLHGKLGSG